MTDTNYLGQNAQAIKENKDFLIEEIVNRPFDTFSVNELADRVHEMTPEQLERAVEGLKANPGIDIRQLFRDALKGETKQRGGHYRKKYTKTESAESAETGHTDDNTYTIVENYALDHPDCQAYEIAAYSIFCRHAHFPKKTTTVSITGIADRLGINWRTAKQAIDNLVSLGLLVPTGKTPSGATIHTLPHRYRPSNTAKKARK